MDKKEVDEQIMFHGNLVGRVLDAVQSNGFNNEEKGKIMVSLLGFLERLYHKEGFDFRPIFQEIMRLKSFDFEDIVNEEQEKLLSLIMESVGEIPNQNESEWCF